ncbi:MAG: hypothetical protein K1X31_10530 [Gemmatimonadaceae bacterium]|nr:hypothetical protein [Gemmatimonadaceae bacterium]
MVKPTDRNDTHPNADRFPAGMSGPALRALSRAGIRTMSELAKRTRAELAALHGMGPKGIRTLETGLAKIGKHLATD